MTTSNIPIDDQISTLRAVADGRSSYLALRVARGEMTSAAAQRQIDCLEAAMATLNFVRRHREDFHVWWAARQRFMADRAAENAGADGGSAVAP